MKVIKIMSKILFWIILIIIAIYSTIIILQKIIWKDKIPQFMGYKNFIILTGSMAPTLNIGDIVFVKETTDIKEQDIISFKVQNAVVTHRVVEIKTQDEKNLYVTKGDANSGNDVGLVDIKDIEGKYSFKIPLLGNVILFLQKPFVIIVLFFILIVCMMLSPKKSNKDQNNEKEVIESEKEKDS